MRIAHRAVAPILAAMLTFGVMAPGFAATPHAGAKYTGVSTESDHLVLQVNHAGTKVHGRVKDACGDTTKFTAKRIKAGGKFKLVWNNSFGQPSFTVTGKFVTKNKAKGKMQSTVVCADNAARRYSAKIVK
jgi:hypothetical protein